MKENNRAGKKCYLYFTLLFFLSLASVLVYFAYYGKAMVWDCDGVYQHFNGFVYYGKYLRSILRNLWENHTLSIPMWDMSIGYGSDILTTLNYYGIGDPLALLSVITPPEGAEYMYGFLSVLRLYLAGIFFILYCRCHENSPQASVLGALTYCFSGFAIFAFARHPAFINPMLYFPLILLGIDRIFRGGKPWLFIWMTAVSAVSNFYFFYMGCILMFVYAVIVYLKLFSRVRLRELVGWFFKFVGYFMTGVAIAAVTLLPSIMYVLNTDRMSAQNYVPLHYTTLHYMSLLGDFFRVPYVTDRSNNYTILGMVPLVLLAVFVLLIKRKKNTHLKAGLLVLSAFYLIPYGGHILNGFSYVANRWVWGFIMLLSYILVKIYPELFLLSMREKIALFALSIFYAAATFLTPEHGGGQTPLALATLLVLCAAVAAGGCPRAGKALPVFLYTVTLAGIALNAWDLYAPGRTGYIEEFRAKGKPYQMLTTGSEMYPVKEINDTSGFYRYDQYGVVAHENTAMQNRLHGTDFYFSVSNGNVSSFFNDLYLYAVCDRMYDNLDGRAVLERLASVRYFVSRQDAGARYVPYAFEEKAGGNRKFAVYRSEETLPFGYTYDHVIPEDTFENLPVEQRQQALLQGALVEEQSDLPQAEPVFCDERPEFQIIPDGNVTVDGNRFTVAQKGASVRIDFTGMADSETYLVMKGMQYEGVQENLAMRLTMGDVEKKYNYYTYKHNFYSGIDDFLCNMGYSQEAPSCMTLKFSAAGTYFFEDFYVVCQPVAQWNEQTAALRENILEQAEFSDNRITGNIQLDEPKLLVFSMAYSDGWTAFVDGQPQELQRVNRMFPGLELTAGEHSVELHYRTPYLREGLLISALGLLVLCALALWQRKNRREAAWTGHTENTESRLN